jgi:UDP-glucose:(heptosyl)LPS alpha-1,3-glucosyltransferase
VRIAYVVPRCLPTNGHGRYALEVVQALGPGHEVHIFSSAFPDDVNLPARLHRVPLPDWPALARLASWWALSPLLFNRRDFDVIHTQGADAPVGTVVTAACCNQALRAALEEAGDRRWMYRHDVPASLARFMSRLTEIADGRCVRHERVRGIIAPSRRVQEELQSHYGVSTANVTVIPHGVDLETFSQTNVQRRRAAARRTFGFEEGDIVAVFVGGAYRLKGLPAILEALPRIPRNIDNRLRLLVVGVTEDVGLKIERASNRSDEIVFAGQLTDMLAAYAAGDLFVLPTLYDGFSLATLEAMACGLPVIVSRRAGVSELLTDGVDALLLQQPTDAVEIAHALQKLLEEGSLRTILGSSARTTAEKYSWAETARKTMDVYVSGLG